ncbi:L-asparaginase [Rhizoctonia solani AG-1 IA]|uniref:L-asparaginase n=1 Tax=Thanatephorus cucumeris (strain AG1-IA) TaxID=983506 RepID=L8X797_THACA|nr:L-asparaginase [Rhizoctonia solani AG-1 IA]
MYAVSTCSLTRRHVQQLEAKKLPNRTLLDLFLTEFAEGILDLLYTPLRLRFTFRTLSDSFHHTFALKLPHRYARTSYTKTPINTYLRYRGLRVEGVDHLHRGSNTGTIGMLVNEVGSYAPEPFFLTQTLRAQARFHDPEGASLFSNASNVANYRQWSNRSGNSTPSVAMAGEAGNHQPELLVRSSRPIRRQNVRDGEVKKDGYYEGYLPSLVTPRSKAVGGNTKRVRYAILESPDWLAIATEIELNYSTYDGFIVLHGTDTMCYTSSALSFLLEDLGKTVLRNDGIENLLGALSIAGQYVIPEVCLYFNHTLFRGNRVSKVSSFDLNAFASPNFPPLVNGMDEVSSPSESKILMQGYSWHRYRGKLGRGYQVE